MSSQLSKDSKAQMCHQNTCHLCPDLFTDGFIPKRCVDLITLHCSKDAIHQLDMKLEREEAAGNHSLLFTGFFLRGYFRAFGTNSRAPAQIRHQKVIGFQTFRASLQTIVRAQH